MLGPRSGRAQQSGAARRRRQDARSARGWLAGGGAGRVAARTLGQEWGSQSLRRAGGLDSGGWARGGSRFLPDGGGLEVREIRLGSWVRSSGSGLARVCAYRRSGRSPSRGGRSCRCRPRSRAPACSFLSVPAAAPAPLATAEQPLKAAARRRSSSRGTRPPNPRQGERGRRCPAPARPPAGQLNPRVESRWGRSGDVNLSPYSPFPLPGWTTLPFHVYGLRTVLC